MLCRNLCGPLTTHLVALTVHTVRAQGAADLASLQDLGIELGFPSPRSPHAAADGADDAPVPAGGAGADEEAQKGRRRPRRRRQEGEKPGHQPGGFARCGGCCAPPAGWRLLAYEETDAYRQAAASPLITGAYRPNNLTRAQARAARPWPWPGEKGGSVYA